MERLKFFRCSLSDSLDLQVGVVNVLHTVFLLLPMATLLHCVGAVTWDVVALVLFVCLFVVFVFCLLFWLLFVVLS